MAAEILRSSSRSVVGRVRSHNEDVVVDSYPVFAVIDGMGGHSAGDVASRLVGEHLAGLTTQEVVRTSDVARALAAANDEVLSRWRGDSDQPTGELMGATAAGVVVVDDAPDRSVLAFNIGDCRVYQASRDGLWQVTVDHSEVQEMVDAGVISPLEARTHPRRNVVTRAVGTSSELAVDYLVVPVQQGARFLICSDGLTTELDDQTVAELLASDDADQAADALIAAALEAGGRDNISLVLVDCVEGGPTGDRGSDTAPLVVRRGPDLIDAVPTSPAPARSARSRAEMIDSSDLPVASDSDDGASSRSPEPRSVGDNEVAE